MNSHFISKAKLIVLSACESGAGRLIQGEGIMSLSRAFSFAGCANIIPAMGKADDAATAYISERLHHYIAEGFTQSRALQQAKIDYLDDDSVSPAKKQPGYWANMRLIGNFEEPKNEYGLWYLIIGGIVVAGIILLASKKMGLF